MKRVAAEGARAILLEADHTDRLTDLQVVYFCRPETAPVAAPVYSIAPRAKGGYTRHISDFKAALAFAGKLRVRKEPRR